MALVRFVVALFASAVALVAALPLLVAAFPFLLVAVFTRALARRREPAAVGWEELMEYRSELGWKPKPSLNRHYMTVARDAICTVKTDSEGWPESAPWSVCETVVVGDSYAFGYGIDAEDAFFSVDSTRIKAIGAPAYNMAQELLIMQQIAPRLAGKTIVWWIYLGNDLLDNLLPAPLGYRTPFVRRNAGGSWDLVADHVTADRWTLTKHPDYPHALAQMCTSSFLAQRAYGAVEFLIRKGKATCEAAGADLIVMTIPAPAQLSDSGWRTLRTHLGKEQTFDNDLPDRRISAICAEMGIPFIAGKEHLSERHYKRGDPHWNREGHAHIAQLLNRRVSEVRKEGQSARQYQAEGAAEEPRHDPAQLEESWE